MSTTAEDPGATVRAESRMLIGGKLVDAQSGRQFASINPATEEVFTEVADAWARAKMLFSSRTATARSGAGAMSSSSRSATPGVRPACRARLVSSDGRTSRPWLNGSSATGPSWHAEQAAVEGHAALPHLEHLQRMREEIARLVEQHVSQTPTQHHTHGAIQQKVVHLYLGNGCQPLPDAQAPQQQEQDETHHVHQAVPVDFQKAQIQRNGIELWVNQHGE